MLQAPDSACNKERVRQRERLAISPRGRSAAPQEFVVRSSALVWEHAGVGFLLQGAGSKADAVRLASSVN